MADPSYEHLGAYSDWVAFAEAQTALYPPAAGARLTPADVGG